MADLIPDGELERMADFFRVLADPSRLAMLRCLIEGGEMNVGKIGSLTSHSQANTSKHLKLMLESGVLTRRKEGLMVYYSVSNPVVEQVFRLVSNTLRTPDQLP
jgi:DNA-binding transcriptional ArsR family regulator